jgi:hypothetical protein
VKVAGVDQQAAPIDVRSVDPDHRCPRSGPHAQPRTLPAPEIDDIADREDSRQPGHDPLRRANRERGEKAVKVCTVLVHDFSLMHDSFLAVHLLQIQIVIIPQASGGLPFLVVLYVTALVLLQRIYSWSPLEVVRARIIANGRRKQPRCFIVDLSTICTALATS